MYRDLIRNEFFEIIELMKLFIADNRMIKSIEDSAKMIAYVFKNGGKVLSCGNGGSHCNAMHFSEELTGRYRDTRKGYPAIVISDPSYFSCVSNDFGYEYVFSRYLESVGTGSDLLFSISTSGKSINILNAIHSARVMGMKIVSLTGGVSSQGYHYKKIKKDNIITTSDGNISSLLGIDIVVPHSKYPDRIQEVHMKIIHTLILLIEKEMLN